MSPSIPIRNIYYMLTYAFEELTRKNYEQLRTESFTHALDLYAAILVTGVGKQVKQGLIRAYRSEQENLPLCRGKLILPGTIRNAAASKRLLCCEYDELTENYLHNRIIKSTILLLIRSGKDAKGQEQVQSGRKAALKRLLPFFADVDELCLDTVVWRNLVFDKSHQDYTLLVGLCRLVYEETLLTDDRGQQHLASFRDQQKLFHLYEKFLLNYYKREFPELHPAASYIPWALDDDERNQLPLMKTDVTLSDGKKILILDAKCYTENMQRQYDIPTIHSVNLYQIFTYVKNKQEQVENGEMVGGMLLYARTKAQIQPDAVFRMNGNPILVRTLDLNQPFEEIRKCLDGIATAFFSSE